MHQLLVGIEHMMTGLQLICQEQMRFERESASVVRVISSVKIEAYWPVKQAWLESVEVPDREAETFSSGEVDHYARVLGRAMLQVDTSAVDQLEIKGVPVPSPEVVKAMRAKFGAYADKHISDLKWDGLNKCYYFMHAQMYHGVEPDGYIHT